MMPFGKKKNEGEAAAEPAALVNLFEQEAAGNPEETLAEAPSGDGAAAAAPDPASADAASTEAPETPAEAPTAPTGADALLSLFQEDEGGDEDRAIMLDLAGEVAIADL